MDRTDERGDDLVRWLAERSAECPVCGYNVRGLRTPQCPECAAPLELTLRSPNQGIGPWALAMVSLSAAAGFDLVLTACFAVVCVLHGLPPMYIMLRMLVLAVLGVACAVAMVVLISRRKRWMRLPVSLQWRWGWVILAAVATPHLLYGGYLLANTR
ncbi:MAG: hypothetical protein ACREJO_16355 [Phycisphaerales bacterium]